MIQIQHGIHEAQDGVHIDCRVARWSASRAGVILAWFSPERDKVKENSDAGHRRAPRLPREARRGHAERQTSTHAIAAARQRVSQRLNWRATLASVCAGAVTSAETSSAGEAAVDERRRGRAGHGRRAHVVCVPEESAGLVGADAGPGSCW